jgi:hypothetical protein
MEQSEKYKAQLVIVSGFLILFIVFKHKAFLYTSLSVALISAFIPFLGNWIVKTWFLIGHVLGWVNSKIILSVIFFIFLSPIAFLYRLLKKDNLNLKSQDESLYTTRDHKYTPEDLKNTW